MPLDRTPLKRCDYTHLMFPLDFFVLRQGKPSGTSFLGALWINVSQRSVNGRYAKARSAAYPGNTHHLRGIRMAPEWVDDPTAFGIWILTNLGMPRRDEAGNRLSLDRINNAGHYEPGNLRWATPLQQAANKGYAVGGREHF